MTGPVRVGLVCPRFSPRMGGVETHAGRLARGLAARGMAVTVVTQDRPASLPAEAHPDGYTIRRFTLPPGLPGHAVAPGLVGHVLTAASRYDLLHAHDYHALPALAAAAAPRVPLALSTHYRGATRGRERLHRLYRPFGSLLLDRAAVLVCSSAAERDALLADFPQVADRVEVVPPGLEPALAAAAPFDVPGRVLLAVGRLDRTKRLDLLIDALPALPADVRLVLVGDGPAAGPLTELAAVSPAADRIVLTGPIGAGELARWRATATLAATSSEQATSALGFAEALAAGLPTVASDLPVHREVAGLFTAGPAVTFVSGGPFAWARALRSALAAADPTVPSVGAITWAQRADTIAALYRRIATGDLPRPVAQPAAVA